MLRRAAIALVCVGWAATATAQQGAPLRVLARAANPYFYLHDGKPSGLEYEILAYFAKTQGRPLVVTWVDKFEDLLPMLSQGRGDIAAGTLSITPERERMFGFSPPYLTIRVVLVERREHATASLTQLRGETLATIAGTTYAKELAAVPNAKFVYGEKLSELFEMISRGNARAAAADSLSALQLLPKYPQLKQSLALTEPQGYGFAVAKGTELEKALDDHVDLLRSSPIYFRMLDKYFGKGAAAMIAAARR